MEVLRSLTAPAQDRWGSCPERVVCAVTAPGRGAGKGEGAFQAEGQCVWAPWAESEGGKLKEAVCVVWKHSGLD